MRGLLMRARLISCAVARRLAAVAAATANLTGDAGLPSQGQAVVTPPSAVPHPADDGGNGHDSEARGGRVACSWFMLGIFLWQLDPTGGCP